MARRKQTYNGRAFLVLLVVVVLGGVLLWSRGDLANPFQSTMLINNLSGVEPGFTMVGDGATPPERVTTMTDEESTDAVDAVDTTEAVAETSTVETTSVEMTSVEAETIAGMTMDEFTAQLAAAGVDVDSVSATMSAEGRSLDNLLAVVNSGRVTVDELALRLSGEIGNSTAETTTTTTETDVTDTVETDMPLMEDRGGEMQLLDIHWEEFGSVAYDLWVMLAMTLAIMMIARPVGWLVKQIKPARQKPVRSAISQ